MPVQRRIQPFAFTWDAADGAIRTNTQALGLDDVVHAVTVASDTSNSGPMEIEIYLINTGSDRLSVMLEHGNVWNGDVSGQVSWIGELGPFTTFHSVRVSAQNFTGATITVAESILKGVRS